MVIDIGVGGGYFTIFFGHNVDEAFIQQKAENVGYKLIERHDFLQEQSFNVFKLSSPVIICGVHHAATPSYRRNTKEPSLCVARPR